MAAVLVGAYIQRFFKKINADLLHEIGHPFDLTKTRLQTAAPGVYTGAVDVVKQTVARDGVTGCVLHFIYLMSSNALSPSLYRGMLPPLLGVTPIFALSFWVCFRLREV